jgi:hypothetical protein
MNPRSMEFGSTPLGESETSDFSNLKVQIWPKAKN